MERRVSLESSIMGVRVVGESAVVLFLLGSEFSMRWGKIRVRCREEGSLEVYTHGVEIMEETFVQRGSLLKDIHRLFWKYSEKLLLEGEMSLEVPITVVEGLANGARRREMGGFIGERFPWEVPFFEGKVNGTVRYSNGGCGVLGSTHSLGSVLWKGALWEGIFLERAHAEEVRRWESLLKKCHPESINNFREGNYRTYVKKKGFLIRSHLPRWVIWASPSQEVSVEESTHA